MPVLNWNTTRQEHEAIMRLIERIVRLARAHGIDYIQRDAMMDITACHANGCPLELEKMAATQEDDADVLHDLLGIRRHIDRNTGALRDCFVPRYAQANHMPRVEWREPSGDNELGWCVVDGGKVYPFGPDAFGKELAEHEAEKWEPKRFTGIADPLK